MRVGRPSQKTGTVSPDPSPVHPVDYIGVASRNGAWPLFGNSSVVAYCYRTGGLCSITSTTEYETLKWSANHGK